MGSHELDHLFRRFVRDGDPAALDAFARGVVPVLLRWARHLGGHAHADDLVQNSFVTLLAKADGLDLSKPILPWLLGVLSRHWLRVRQDGRVEYGHPPDPVSNRSNPVVLAQWQETSGIVQSAIREMPEVYRPVLAGFLQHELSPHELARLFGVPATSTRSRLFRGLRMLRDRLQGRLRDSGCYALWCWRTQWSKSVPKWATRVGWAVPGIAAIVLLTAFVIRPEGTTGKKNSEHPGDRTVSSVTTEQTGPVLVERQVDRTTTPPETPSTSLSVSGNLHSGPDEVPVFDADVHLMILTDTGPKPVAKSMSSMSDEDGAFEIHIAEPIDPTSQFVVIAQACDQSLGWSYLPPISNRGSITVDIVFPPNALISARVIDHRKRPVVGAEVAVLPSFPPWPLQDASIEPWRQSETHANLAAPFTTTTDHNGEILVRVPSPPSTHRRFDEPTRTRELLNTWSYRIRCSHLGWFLPERTVRVADAEPAPTTIVAYPTNERRIGGRAHTTRGTPIINAEIWAIAPFSPLTKPRVLTRTDTEGRWDCAMDELPPPPVQLTCIAPDFMESSHLLETLPDHGPIERDFRLQSSQRLLGKVVDDRGHPVVGARLEWAGSAGVLLDRSTVVTRSLARFERGISGEEHPIVDSDRAPGSRVLSDRSGHFALPVPSDGSGHLFVVPPKPWHEWVGASVLRVDEVSSAVVLPRTRTTTASLRVRVRDEATGDILEPIDAYVSPSASQLDDVPSQIRLFEPMTLVEREWIHTPHLVSGDWVVYANIADRALVVEPVHIEAGATECVIDVTAVAPIRVFGELSGKALRDRTFRLERVLDGMAPGWAFGTPLHVEVRVTEEGTFEATGLSPGPWRVRRLRPTDRPINPAVITLDNRPVQEIQLSLPSS